VLVCGVGRRRGRRLSVFLWLLVSALVVGGECAGSRRTQAGERLWWWLSVLRWWSVVCGVGRWCGWWLLMSLWPSAYVLAVGGECAGRRRKVAICAEVAGRSCAGIGWCGQVGLVEMGQRVVIGMEVLRVGVLRLSVLDSSVGCCRGCPRCQEGAGGCDEQHCWLHAVVAVSSQL
jgi:hypothetical protein